MTRLILILLVMLSSTPATGEWIVLDSPYQSHGLRTFYIDPATIRHNGQFVTLSELWDFRWQQGGITGRRFQSATGQKQVNCPTRQYRILSYTDFVGTMGTGDARNGAVEPDAWHTIEPESMNQTLWEMVCTKF